MLADIYTAVAASSYLAGITQRLGAEFLAERDAPSRMVWVPTNDTFVAGDNGRRNTADKLHRPVGTRIARVRIRMWAKASVDTPTDDIRAIETMTRKLVNAISSSAHGDFTLDGGEWVAAEGEELMQYGRAYDLSVAFNIPMFRDPVVVGITTAGPPLQQANADIIKDFGPEGND